MSEQPNRHQAVWALLPWMANGTATPAQRQAAEAHLLACAECRAELARETALAQHLSAEVATAPPVEAGLARLMQRLDQAEAEAGAGAVAAGPGGPGRPPAANAPAPRRRRGLWTVWAGRPAAAAVAALGLLEVGALAAAGLWWWHQPSAVQAPAAYRTLSSEPVAPAPPGPLAGPRWRVVFDDSARLHDVQRLLQQHGLRMVAGPSEAGVFTLGALQPASGAEAAAQADVQAQALRQSPLVRFAEVQSPAGGSP